MMHIELIQSSLVFSGVFYLLISYLFGAFDAKSAKSSFTSLSEKKSTLYKCLIAISLTTAVKLAYDAQSLPVNFYTVMEVGRHDSIIDVRKSYKTLSKTYHPDKNTASNAEQIFQTIKTAYDVLMDETQRDIYNRFGSFNVDFDPRKDELSLIVDLLTVYAFWGVVAYVSTLPAGAKGSRTWITIIGIIFLALEVAFKLTESSLPNWMPKSMTEFEFIFYLHSLFPSIIAILRSLSESQYLDLDNVTAQVLADVWQHEKSVNELLLEFEILLEVTKKNVNESNENVQINNVKEKIRGIKSELEDYDERYSHYLQNLKASTNNVGSNYYWLIFILLYGGIYFFQ